MNFLHPIIPLLVTLHLACLLPALAQEDEEEPKPVRQEGVPARLTLRNGTQQNVFLVGRGGTKWVRVEEAGNPEMSFQHPPANIARIDFVLSLGSAKLSERYGRHEYEDTATILSRVLEPLMRFIDLPNNAMPLVQMQQRSLFWSQRWSQLNTFSSQVIERVNPADPAVLEAQAFKAFALQELGKPDEALALIQGMEHEANQDEVDAAYWFALGAIQLENNLLDQGQEAMANVTAVHTKDRRWMPAGLYYSAKGYILANNYDSAEIVLGSIGLAYPNSRWADRVEDLMAFKRQHEAAWLRAEQQREEKEAEEAAFLAKPFREQVHELIARKKIEEQIGGDR